MCRGVPQRSKHNSPSVKPSIIVLDSQRWHFATSGWKAKRKASLAGLEKQFSSISSMFPATQKLFILRPLLISHNQSSNSGSCNATLFFFFALLGIQWPVVSSQVFMVSPMMAQQIKNPPTNAGDAGSILGLGRSPGGGHGDTLWYSCLGNPMDRRAWWVIVHGVAKSQTLCG